MSIRDMSETIQSYISALLDAKWVGYLFVFCLFSCCIDVIKRCFIYSIRPHRSFCSSDNKKKWYYEDQGDYYET